MTIFSSHGQYISFFGDSIWNYSMTYLNVDPEFFFGLYQPLDSVHLALNPLGTHCQSFVYCFDRKDSAHYQLENPDLSDLYYHGNRYCTLAKKLEDFYPSNQFETPKYILNDGVKTILKEDRETGNFYRDEWCRKYYRYIRKNLQNTARRGAKLQNLCFGCTRCYIYHNLYRHYKEVLRNDMWGGYQTT